MTAYIRQLLAAATLTVTLLAGVTTAHAAARSGEPGVSCASTSSAINQYCEDIPTATGGRSPTGPARVLGVALPHAAVSAYSHLPAAKRRRARKLLSLPAASASIPLTGSLGHGSPWSLPIGVILAMIAIVAASAAAALARWRRRSE